MMLTQTTGLVIALLISLAVSGLGWWMLAEIKNLTKEIDDDCTCQSEDYKSSSKNITMIMAIIGSLATVLALAIIGWLIFKFYKS